MRTKVAGLCVAMLPVLMATPIAARSQQESETYSLRRAIQVALSNSRTIEDAEQTLEGARQQVREAWSAALPDVSATASYQRNLMVQEFFLPAEFFGGPAGELRPVRVGSDNTWSAGLTASQTLFEYSVFVGVGAAGRYRELQEEVVRGTTQQVVTAVRQAYFDALLVREELRLTEESIARVRRSLEETRARYAAGLVSEYDVLRLEVELSGVEANLERARNGVASRQRALLVELGLDADLAIELEGRLDEIDPEDVLDNSPENQDLVLLAGVPDVTRSDVDRLIDAALRSRSDLLQLQATLDLEHAQVSLEKAQFYPKLSLFSNYNVLAQQDGRLNFFGDPQNRTTTAAAGLQVEIPVFRGFGRFARVQQARSRVRQNETRLARAEQETLNQVRTLYDAVGEALARARSQRRAVDQAQRGYDIASAEYREGLGSQLQLTDAEVALRQAQYNYARAVYDHLSAKAQLELAIGMVPELAGEFPASWERRNDQGDHDAR